MKNVKFLVSAFLSVVLLSSSAYSNDGVEAKSPNKSVSETVKGQIESLFSEVTVDKDVDVVVKFSVDKEKGFELQEVSSTNDEFSALVSSKLKHSKLYVPKELSGSYLVKIRFVNSSSYKTETLGTEALRSYLQESLASFDIPYSGSVDLVFSVKNDVLSIVDVKGTNLKLVNSLKDSFKAPRFDAPKAIDGYYQVKLTF